METDTVMAVLSEHHLSTLKPGDTFETPGLMRGLEPEDKVIWKLESIMKEDFIFEVSYMGVALGMFVAMRRNGKITVEEL